MKLLLFFFLFFFVYSSCPPKNAYSQDFKPIRITYDFSKLSITNPTVCVPGRSVATVDCYDNPRMKCNIQCTKKNTFTSTMMKKLKKMLNEISSELKRNLLIRRSVANSLTLGCGCAKHIPVNYNSDIIVILDAEMSNDPNSHRYIGSSGGTCLFDNNHIPLAGRLSFSPEAFMYSHSIKYDKWKDTIMHETIHAIQIGLPVKHMPYGETINVFYTKDNNEETITKAKEHLTKLNNINPRLPADTSIFKSFRSFLHTPNSIKFAREYFQCPSLVGIETQEFRIFSHSNKAVYWSDMMSYGAARRQSLSLASLAPLFDTPYIKPNPASTSYEIPIGGRGAGCDYAKGCYANDNASWRCKLPQDFSKSSCTADHLSSARCKNSIEKGCTAQDFVNGQYLTIPKGNCDIYQPSSYDTPCTTINKDPDVYSGEQRLNTVQTRSARCFMGNAAMKRYLEPYDTLPIRARCLRTRCDSSGQSYKFYIGGRWYKCNRKGQKKITSGKTKGYITCADPKVICYHILSRCDPVCINGACVNKKCICTNKCDKTINCKKPLPKRTFTYKSKVINVLSEDIANLYGPGGINKPNVKFTC